MAFKKMSSEDLRLAKLWYDEDGKTPLENSQLLRRDKSTITRHVVQRARQKRLGRPRALTESEVDALESLLVKMIKKANREYEATLEMLRQEVKCRASVKTIRAGVAAAFSSRAGGISRKGSEEPRRRVACTRQAICVRQ